MVTKTLLSKCDRAKAFLRKLKCIYQENRKVKTNEYLTQKLEKEHQNKCKDIRSKNFKKADNNRR